MNLTGGTLVARGFATGAAIWTLRAGTQMGKNQKERDGGLEHVSGRFYTVSHGRMHKSALLYSNSAHVLTCMDSSVCTDTCSVPALWNRMPTSCGCSGGSMLFNYQRPKVLQINAVEKKRESERERD